MKIKFLGASGTVTGSKYLVHVGNKHILVDCGVFQGDKEWKDRNWHNFEEYTGHSVSEIDCVLLTHAHIDHTAFLPKLYLQGFRGAVYATKPTVELCHLLLPDYGKIQEEDAEYRSRKGISSHHPPLPLYTVTDAIESLTLFKSVTFNEQHEILPGIFATWRRMGHILGAGSITLEGDSRTITFSGDIGRYNVPILVDPEPAPLGDLVLIESTYGDKLHPPESPQSDLARYINKTAARGGAVIIPSFAVGRTQMILFYLRELKEHGKIPDIPIIVDSPMARDATQIYRVNQQCYDEQSAKLFQGGREPFIPTRLRFTRDVEESKMLNRIQEPMIIISASGMLTGGRVLHHLYHRISSPLNTVLFVGYQAQGTKGAWIKSGAATARLFKEEVPIRAEIGEVPGLSAHADRDEMWRWCAESFEKFKRAPGMLAFVHGEPDTLKVFSEKTGHHFGWRVKVPKYLEEIKL
jgi:metallo-beta-lactamase family protein